MSYIWLPLLIIFGFFILSCVRAAVENDYNSPEWARFIGHITLFAAWGYGLYSVAMLGHFIVTGH